MKLQKVSGGRRIKLPTGIRMAMKSGGYQVTSLALLAAGSNSVSHMGRH